MSITISEFLSFNINFGIDVSKKLVLDYLYDRCVYEILDGENN